MSESSRRAAYRSVDRRLCAIGGEIAALAVLDACVRLIPGVMGKEESGADESFERGLLEYPHYTRPREWEGRAIPDVLLSGDHAKIAAWRRSEAERITRERRPDLTQPLGAQSTRYDFVLQCPDVPYGRALRRKSDFAEAGCRHGLKTRNS